MLQVAPKDWGARVNYDTWTDPTTLKDKIIIHYAGAEKHASQAYAGIAREKELLRSYERYHLDSKGWRGIAYGWAVGMSGTVYRLRGWSNYGAHTGDLDKDGINENREGIPVLFILGGDMAPTEAALSAFKELKAYLDAEDSKLVPTYRQGELLPVYGHRDVSTTPCPGEPMYAKIKARFWDVPVVNTGTPIKGEAQVPAEQAHAWAAKAGAHPRFHPVINYAWTHGARYNVRPEVVVALAAKETNFGKFVRGDGSPGTVTPEHHNWGGLKIAKGGGNYDPAAHQYFPDDEKGTIAVIQHLDTYAGNTTWNDPVWDERYVVVAKGSAPMVEGLDGRWAGPTYGTDLVRFFLKPLMATKAPAPAEVPAPTPPAPGPAGEVFHDWAAPSIELMKSLGIMVGSGGSWNQDGPVTRAQLAVVIDRTLGYLGSR